MSENTQSIDNTIKQQILTLDITTFNSDINASAPVMKAFKRDVKANMVKTLLSSQAVLFVVGVALAVFDINFFVLTFLALFVALFGFIIIDENVDGDFIEQSELKNVCHAERENQVRDRIYLQELVSGGIYQFSSYIDLSNLNPEQAEAWAAVIKKSYQRKKITDVATYYSILRSVISALKDEDIKAQVSRLNEEVQALAPSKQDNDIIASDG